MNKALSVMLFLAISTAAAEPLLVSLDPLPYGAIQLAFNQYLIPNVGGVNVLLYSSTPLTFAQPGQTFTPKATLSLSPLPFGAVRMNDSQYMIPAVMPGVMALVVSATPLSFAASPLALQTPGSNPATAITPTSTPSPAALAVEEAKKSTPTPPPPTVVTAVAIKDSPPAPVTITPEVPRTTSVATTMPEVLKAAPPVATTPELPKTAPVASTTPAVSKAAPVTTDTPDVPQTTVPTAQRERGVDAALTTEVKASTRLPRLPGLPDDLTGNITITQHSNTVTFSYTLTSLGTTTYTLNPTTLRLTQDGLGIRARLDRRNGNLTPGTLAPGKGEIGSITVNRTTSADVQLTWLITDNAGHTYTLTATTAQYQGALSVR